MKIIFIFLMTLFSQFGFAQRFDQNNINENLFIAIKCIGITESKMTVGNKVDISKEKYQKYLIIDKESKLVLNYFPNETEQFTISRGDWKISSKKVVGSISNEDQNASLVSHFEYDLMDNSFKEVMVVSNKTGVMFNKTEGVCGKLKSLPR